MSKIVITLIIATISPLVMANNDNWIETQKDSHIFIKTDDIVIDKQNPDIRTTKISINVPSMQERKANPTKTVLTNPYPISYITDFTINCKDKTGKIGKQAVHEKFFGEGELLESADNDPNAKFIPIEGVDATKMLDVVCNSSTTTN